MNKYSSKRKLYLFLMVVAIESMAANFAHPITPTIIKNLELPDYMFGVAFAGMAFTNFLFSPMWAKMVNRISSRTTLLISCSGYGFGQILFMLATSSLTILVARLVSGFFVGGVMVSMLTYIVNKAEPESRGKFLALNATFATVFGAFGYLIGGLLGVVSITLTFILQAIALSLSGILFFIFLDDDKKPDTTSFNLLRDANPFKAFLDSKRFMNELFIILFSVVFITSLASTAYDQSFNYYIKDVFEFNSSYNGILKAIVGFISLLVNTTLALWILRNTNVRKALVWVFMGASISLLCIYLVQSMAPFIIFTLLFFAFNALYIPLIQDLCAKSSDESNSVMVMGMYNAMKGLGMIVGGLFAGFVYVYGNRISFLSASFLFGVALMLMVYSRKYRKRTN